MPGVLMHQLATVTCPHGGTIAMPPGPRVKATLQSVSPKTVPFLDVKLCPFTVPTPGGPKPQPCLTVQWPNVSSRVQLNGFPIFLQGTPPAGPVAGAMCFSAEQIPQGPPIVQRVQTRVIAM